jgi:hypothetical protein
MRDAHNPGWRFRWEVLVTVMVAASAWAAFSRASECSDSIGADVVNGALLGVHRFGTIDAVTSYAFGFVACNLGSEPMSWKGTTADHPVVAQNLYRLKDGRFEQIGLSWVKHVYGASAADYCCACVDPQDTYLLGVGCSDAYGASLNGNQGGSGTAGGLGPRSEVNPYTGEFAFPYGSQGQAGDALYKRLQVKNSDLAPANNSGALYFGEIQLVGAEDSNAGNQFNNICYEQLSVGAFSDGGWDLIDGNSTNVDAPAIYAWQQFDPEVNITNIDVPDDGRLVLASRCTQNANGTWHYEYALYNMNCHRAVRMFGIPIPPGAQLTNIGFHDIAYHSGEPFNGSAWEVTQENGQLRWKTDTHDANPNANALRWGTLYNFRFNIDAPPSTVSGKVYLFKPGSLDQIAVDICGPAMGMAAQACEQAQPVSLGSTTFSNTGSSLNVPPISCADSSGHVMWFKYESTFSGTLRISTCNSADFNTALAVYSGCSCAAFNLLACKDNTSGCDGGAKIEIEAEAGHCYLIQLAGSGNASGSGTLKLSCGDSDNAARADLILTGEDPGGRFGYAIANAGKFNGASSSGIIVGAYSNNQSGAGAGAAQVFYGTALDQHFDFNGSPGDSCGQSVAGGGDFDGDGHDDWIIGMPMNDENGSAAGKVVVYSSARQAVLWSRMGQAAGDRFGWSIACAGDVNEDGVADVIVGAPYNDARGSNSGRAYVYDGSSGDIIYKLSGTRAGDRFGAAVAGIGDLNDDGAADFAIGAPYYDASSSNSGRVSIYSGANKTVIQKINGSSAGDQFGSAIAGLTYGSGSSERTLLIVGAPFSNVAGSNSGEAKVFLRKHNNPVCGNSLCLQFTLKGKNAGDRFGASVAIGNVRGSSKPDFVVGAPYADLNGSSSGTVTIFDGSTGNLEERIYGEASGDRLGCSVAVTDVNGDAKNDLVVGAPNNDAAGSAAGRVYGYLSSNSSMAFLIAQDDSDALPPFLNSDEGKADVDKDGLVNASDLLVVLNSWGPCPSVGSNQCPVDIAPAGGDGVIDVEDMLAVISTWLEDNDD